MTARIFGAVLLFSVACYLGIALSQRARRRVAELSAFCRLLSDVRDGIRVMRLPLDAIFEKQSGGALADNGFFDTLRTCTHTGSPTPLHDALGAHREKHGFALTEEDMAELLAFSAALGTADASREAARCDYHLAALEARHRAAEDSLSADARVLRVLPMSAAGLLIILFL